MFSLINKLLLKSINKMKIYISNTLFLLGGVISKILNIYCYLNNISIVVIREDRYGHQIGTLDCELFLACKRKEEFNILIISEN